MRALRILQTNLGRARVAHDIAMSVSRDPQGGVDILVVAEPNRKITGVTDWLRDLDGDVAVYCVNKHVGVKGVTKGHGCLRIEFGEVDMTACYVSPNLRAEEYRRRVDEVMEIARNGPGRGYIILGDLNAKSGLWGSPSSDWKGQYWEGWVSECDLVIHNWGNVPTFVRGVSESYIDVTLSSENAAGRVRGWRVLEQVENLSYHRYIRFEVDVGVPNRAERENKIWGKPYRDPRILSACLGMLKESVEGCPERLSKILSEAQTAAEDERESGRRRWKPYWWNEEISELRERSMADRRRWLRERRRARDPVEQAGLVLSPLFLRYKESRREYKKAIEKSKKTEWDRLLEEVDADVWGQGYKIVTRGLRNASPAYEVDEETKHRLLGELFPLSEAVRFRRDPVDPGAVPCFTVEEMVEAAAVLKPGKAPGPDGVSAETVRIAVKEMPEALLAVFNRLVCEGSFPAVWKRAKVVLIPKDQSGQKFRPISLLDTVGKLYELMLRKRLNEEIDGMLSGHQYGFRRGRSTVEAVLDAVNVRNVVWTAMICLDVKNAFNTADWGLVVGRLREMGVSAYLVNVVGSYLSCRRIGMGGRWRDMTMGVPQGSVLGPTLWNVLYDRVLRLAVPPDCKLVAYADDLAVIVGANKKNELNERMEICVRRVEEWMRANKLQLAGEKTEIVVFRGPRNREDVGVNVGGQLIVPIKVVKYLGIYLDDKLIYNQHVKETVAKAEKLAAALYRLMPNMRGPSGKKRRVLFGAVLSILLYGAPVWGCVAESGKHGAMLNGIQRRMAIRVIRGYRTVSTEAACVVAGVPPITLLVKERLRVQRRKEEGRLMGVRREEREVTMRMWQDRWDALVETGQWTKRLIPNIAAWMNCEWRVDDYFLTQFLTGHGSFRAYTRRIGRSEDDVCLYCDQTDTVEHTIFACRRWAAYRVGWTDATNADSIVEEMMESRETWGLRADVIRRIMNEKEREERIWQREGVLPLG